MNPEANEIVKQKHLRAFTQRGGARPGNQVRFAGADEQYLMIGDIANPVRGSISPDLVHNPYSHGDYVDVGETVEPPDLPTATVTFRRDIAALSWLAGELRCPVTFYELTGQCGNPSDFRNGWTSSITILSDGLAGPRAHQGRTAFDSDDPTTDEVEFTFRGGVYDIGNFAFAAHAAAYVTREVVDAAFGTALDCGDCGATNDGTQHGYAVTKSSGAGSPGMPAEIIYTTDGWTTEYQADLGIGATVDPAAIRVVGPYLVVLVPDAPGYYYATINPLTGVPGTFAAVTAGFSASYKPRDMHVISPREVVFVGDGGYIYRSTDIPSGVTVVDAGSTTTENLARVHGAGGTLIAVGANSAVVKSVDRGLTWGTPTTAATGTLQAVCVKSKYEYLVGTSTGVLSYTLNGGETWGTIALPGSPSAIQDIVAATKEVLFVAATVAGPAARIITSCDGGQSWMSSDTTSPRIPTFPVCDRINRIALPWTAGRSTRANNLLLAGLAGDGVDGVLYSGAAPVK